MAKRKNESQLSMVNNYWSPAILCERPLETDFVPRTDVHTPHNILVPLRWNDPIVRLLPKSDRRVQALTDGLRADDLKWISGYVSVKEPHSPPLWWHQDWWCWDHPLSYRRMAPQIGVLCSRSRLRGSSAWQNHTIWSVVQSQAAGETIARVEQS